jgi:phosphotransferase system enzyme I (PtsI)
LPAVVGLRNATEQLTGNEHVILDGTSGVLIVNPTPTQIKKYRERRAVEALEDKELQALAASESVTLDGHWVTLRANVDLPEEAEFAAHSGAWSSDNARRGRAVSGIPTRRRSVRRPTGSHPNV